MSPTHYALFKTAIGQCGIAWRDAGIVRVQFPEASHQETVRRLTAGFAAAPAKPPRAIERAIARLERHLAGEPQDLSGLKLDLSEVGAFPRRVYEAARKIPPGRTLSYGELARAIGQHGAARAVGKALGDNPFAIVVPCHRVLAANGRLGGFSAHGGSQTKQKLLVLEGVCTTPPELPLFAGAGGLGFDSSRGLQMVRESDPKLAALIARVGPFGLAIKHTDSTFKALCEAIVYQQLNGKAAATIFARFKALYGNGRFPTPERVLATPTAELRAAGLSNNKLLSIRDLAEKVQAGVVPSIGALKRLPDAAIVERLTQVRGIGRWTVEMLLIFRLGRPDVLPTNDYGIRKGFAQVFRKRELPSPAALERHGERWRPYRTVASWYLWRALELDPPRA